MRGFVGLICYILICVGSFAVPPAIANVHADYRAPFFTIPFTTTPPKIDGIINTAEWQSAFSAVALQTTEGAVSTRQARIWMTWDADHLYLAMRSPILRGEKIIQAYRQRGRDNSKIVFDDSYEIWLNAGTHSPDGEPVFFQYLGNYAGAKYDVMFEPAVGNSRPGWESGWHPVSRITPDGKFWEMEVAIPRQSIYKTTPFTNNEDIHGLFVRNFKNPWEQNSLGGSGSFSVPETHCTFHLSKDAPAIHLLAVCNPQSKTFGIALTASSQPLQWTFRSDSGLSKTGGLPTSQLQLDHPGDGFYRIHITSPDGQTEYLDWCSRRAFGDFSAYTQPPDPEANQPNLTLTFNPVENYVRIQGDLINFDKLNDLTRVMAEVLDSTGKPIAQQDLPVDNLNYVRGVLHLENCPPGSYIAQLTGYNQSGNIILQKQSPFTNVDPAKTFPWWNTTAGNIEKVIAPWTSVKHTANRIAVWGRSMQIGAAGLPSQITTQGEKILAGPIELVADNNSREAAHRGTAVHSTAAIATDFDSESRIKLTTKSAIGDIDITTHITAEFDGMYKIQMTLAPRHPTPLNSLKIRIPLNPAFADYFHACGEGIRYGFSYGYLPKTKTGQLWNSKQVDGQPMLVGSFIPYVWVGNDIGGLAWFADSDQGWTPSDATPAIEIRRDSSDHVDLILNLISSPTTLDKPRTITFAFQASPVKPLEQGWRMETWCTGDSFQDWCKVEPRGGHLIWNALPFTLDPAACKKMVEARDSQDMSYIFGLHKYHPNAVPYFENNGIDPKFAPAMAYFSDQWHATVSDSLCYDKTLSDFIVWNLGQWCKQTGIDGWYVDNVRPVACDNIDAGRGYRLPDGRIQPMYQMFATREFFLRVRAVFAENGKHGKFVLHMTNHMILPWLGAADIALDGEDHVTFPEMGKDFMDFWQPDRMRLDYPKPNGVFVSFLQEYQGKWSDPDIHRVMRAYTGTCLLDDILPGANPNGNNQAVWQGRDRFGIQDNDVTFIPGWDHSIGVSCDDANIHFAKWKKPNSQLIAVVNRGEAADAAVRISPELHATSAMDAESGESLDLSSDGVIHMQIPRHDYRQIILQTQSR